MMMTREKKRGSLKEEIYWTEVFHLNYWSHSNALAMTMPAFWVTFTSLLLQILVTCGTETKKKLILFNYWNRLNLVNFLFSEIRQEKKKLFFPEPLHFFDKFTSIYIRLPQSFFFLSTNIPALPSNHSSRSYFSFFLIFKRNKSSTFPICWSREREDRIEWKNKYICV